MNLSPFSQKIISLVFLSFLFFFFLENISCAFEGKGDFIDLTTDDHAGSKPFFSLKTREGEKEEDKGLSSGQQLDDMEEDLTFLAAAAQEIEDSLLSHSPLPSACVGSSSKKPRMGSLPAPTAAAFAMEDLFSNPEILKVVDDAETAYKQEKKSLPPQKKPPEEISSKLLTTFRQHQDHLFSSLKQAKRSILITSHSFSATLKSHRGLFEALREASLRHVTVYLYFNKDSGLNPEEIHFLEETGIKLSNPLVHSKLLIIDKDLVTCGSFDWLNNPTNLHTNRESSVVLEGKDLNPFIQEIWETLKKYKQVSMNPLASRRVERNFSNLSSLAYETDTKNEEFELLTTPQQHDDFFHECFETAQHRIALCAPFITRDPRFLESLLPKSTLIPFLREKKLLQIFYRSNDDNFIFLRQYLADIACPNLIFTPLAGLHRKTLIMDDKYAEGSFNWLSSARTLEDDYFLMETSFIFTGPKAKAFIDAFYHSLSSPL